MSDENNNNIHLVPIATPLASDNVEKKLHKIIKQAVNDKCLKRGIKDTMKLVKKETDTEKMKEWLCVIAGDVTPLDIISHIPAFMEEKGISYIYVKTREQLGKVAGSKHPTTVVLLTPSSKDECYKDCHKLVKKIRAD